METVQSSPSKRVAVIGAGPAGLMVADRVAARGVHVVLIERMPSPARKFLMAGRGGLNLTHTKAHEEFLAMYNGSLADPIRAAVDDMPAASVRAWAESLGQETFVGSSGRVFPVAMKASPLLRAWLTRLNQIGVEMRLRTRWIGFAGERVVRTRSDDGGEREEEFDAVVLALGGASWPKLGSDGVWADLLAGVEIEPLTPANVGILIDWSAMVRDRFAGMPLKRIGLTVGDWHGRGEAIITRGGLEGGVVYAASEALRQCLAAGPATVRLDLRPDDTVDSLAERLAAIPAKQSFANRLRRAAHLSAAATAVLREGGPIDGRDFTALAHRIKSVPLTVNGLAGLERAISTAGGVTAAAVDDHSMLRSLPGVFVAGEMLDWTAPTGGYLLTACLASGRRTAHGVLRWLETR